MAVSYPCYWMKQDRSGGWYWIYYAINSEEIARSSESYVKRSDCSRSVAILKASKGDKVYFTES